MENSIDAMTAKVWTIDGKKNSSLMDAGYFSVGVDEGWEGKKACHHFVLFLYPKRLISILCMHDKLYDCVGKQNSKVAKIIFQQASKL